MKTAIGGAIALLVANGTAAAVEPVALTDAQLDQVTGGPVILQVPEGCCYWASPEPSHTIVEFDEQHPGRPSAVVEFPRDIGILPQAPVADRNGR